MPTRDEDSPLPQDMPPTITPNQSKQGRSQSYTYSSSSATPTPFSPNSSSIFNTHNHTHMQGYSPTPEPDSPVTSTFLGTSLLDSPGVQPNHMMNFSHVAVHGSVPSSPVLKGMRGCHLKDSEYFTLPHPRTPGFEQPSETSGRIIAIDFDDVCKAHSGEKGASDTAMLDFTTAIYQIHALGHPVHILSSQSSSDLKTVLQWFDDRSIRVGCGKGDHIAGIWFSDSSELPTDGNGNLTAAGTPITTENLQDFEAGRDGTGLEKLKVLQNINAAMFIASSYDDLLPIIKFSQPIPCLLLSPIDQSGDDDSAANEPNLHERSRQDGGSATMHDIAGGDFYRVKSWEEVVEWVKRWDVPKSTRTEDAAKVREVVHAFTD